jgi:cytochrome P450
VNIYFQFKNGEVNYESIGEMKYMDMVIEETLRLFPPSSRVDRVASVDYEYNGIKIKKGQVVAVSLYALHHDPDLYPEPEEFRPERFSDENKKARENEAYAPFGVGPRNCIGMRFALMEIKLLLATILAKYRFEKCAKTPVYNNAIL